MNLICYTYCCCELIYGHREPFKYKTTLEEVYLQGALWGIEQTESLKNLSYE